MEIKKEVIVAKIQVVEAKSDYTQCCICGKKQKRGNILIISCIIDPISMLRNDLCLCKKCAKRELGKLNKELDSKIILV